LFYVAVRKNVKSCFSRGFPVIQILTCATNVGLLKTFTTYTFEKISSVTFIAFNLSKGIPQSHELTHRHNLQSMYISPYVERLIAQRLSS